MSAASETPPDSSKPSVSALSQLRIDRGHAGVAAPRRNWWPLALAAVVLVGGVAWWLAPKPVAVQTAAVVTSTPSQQFVQLTASGYVVAQRRAAVASKATGRLIELNVREGSVVKQEIGRAHV